MMTRAEMWKLYDFRGHRVRVSQQWHDPYGVPFVRIETTDDDDAMAEGMPEADFLSFATSISSD